MTPTSRTAIRLQVGAEVLVLDPCYYTQDGTLDPDRLGVRIPTVEAEWSFWTEVARGRVAKLVGCAGNPEVGGAPATEQVFDAGVDAGLMAIIPDTAAPVEWATFCATLPDDDGYTEPWLAEGRVVASSGFGDGVYPVRVRRTTQGTVNRIEVEFIKAAEL